MFGGNSLTHGENDSHNSKRLDNVVVRLGADVGKSLNRIRTICFCQSKMDIGRRWEMGRELLPPRPAKIFDRLEYKIF